METLVIALAAFVAGWLLCWERTKYLVDSEILKRRDELIQAYIADHYDETPFGDLSPKTQKG